MTDNKTTDIDNTDDFSFFGGDEFVFTQDQNGGIVGGGYKIKSSFLQGGKSIMTTLNNREQDGGKVSSPFENLAVPAGLFYVNMRIPKKELEREHEQNFKGHETISDDIIDKLYSLVEVDNKRKRKTRKHHMKLDKTKTKTRRVK